MRVPSFQKKIVCLSLLLLASCSSALDGPVPVLDNNTSSSVPGQANAVYSIENITVKSHIGQNPYDELVSQKLVKTDLSTSKKSVLIEDLAKEFEIQSMGTPDFRIVHASPEEGIVFFLILGGGADTVSYDLLKYDLTNKRIQKSVLEDLFASKNGDFLRIGSSARYAWAPFIAAGVPTRDRNIFLVDFEHETSSVLVSLPDTETLNGADPCDRYNFITDISVSADGELKFAVYSREKLGDIYVEMCMGDANWEQQALNAKAAFIEYRTVDVPMQ